MDPAARLERIKALLLGGAFLIGTTLALEVAVIVSLACLAVAAPGAIASIVSADLRRIPIAVLLAVFANRAFASLLLASTFPFPEPPASTPSSGAPAADSASDDRQPPLALLRLALQRIGMRLDGRAALEVGTGVAAGAALCMLTVALVVLPAWRGIAVADAPLSWGSWMLYAPLFFAAALAEEAVTRGYLVTALLPSWGRVGAIALSAGSFALLHGNNPGLKALGIVNLVLFGTILGCVFVWRRSLWLVAGLHTGWNFLEGPVLGQPITGVRTSSLWQLETAPSLSQWWTGGALGPEGGAAATLVCSGILVWLIARLRRSSPGA